MASSLITVKAALISTGIAAMAMFIHFFVPIAVDFSVSRFPILWSSFLSWLKPPYLFIVVNVIIIIIVASSRYLQSFGDNDGEDELHNGEFNTQFEPIVSQSLPERLEVMGVDLDAGFDFVAKIPPTVVVADLERSEVVFEEERVVVEESLGLINGGDELGQVPSVMVEPVNLSPAEKPLALARSGNRQPVKVSPKGKGGIKKKAIKVVKPKRRDTLENSWNMITEDSNSAAPLTSHYKKPDTFGLVAGDVKLALRKSETFKDVTNYQLSPTVTPRVKTRKAMSPGLEEMNRKFEDFIRKSKEERLESMRLLDKNIA